MQKRTPNIQTNRFRVLQCSLDFSEEYISVVWLSLCSLIKSSYYQKIHNINTEYLEWIAYTQNEGNTPSFTYEPSNNYITRTPNVLWATDIRRAEELPVKLKRPNKFQSRNVLFLF